MTKNIDSLLLDTQAAINSNIIPEVRAIMINMDIEKDTFFIRIYYDGKISEKKLDLLECIVTEAFEFGIHLDSKIIRLDYPQEIPIEGVIAYWRKEPFIPTEILEIKKYFNLPYHGDQYFKGNIKRAMQNALLGQITPNIREIGIEDSKQFLCIDVHFYYEGEIKETDIKNMHKIMDIFSEKFSSFYIRLKYYRIDMSPNLPSHHILIYERYEENFSNPCYFIPKESPYKNK